MAYSKSPVTLLRRRQHLDPLIRGETIRWTHPFPENVDAAGWAYRIRECLWVAKHNARRFPELARNADSYRVEVLDEKTVQASLPRSSQTAGLSERLDTPEASRINPVVSTEPFAPLTFPNARTRFEIVQGFLSSDGRGPYHFPNASLSPEDLRRLATWATAQTPEWMVIVSRENRAVTLMQFDPTIPESVRVMP